MGMELQLRQSNFGSFSIGLAQLRWDMDFDEAREIIGAYRVTRDDKVKEWFVKVPDLRNLGDSSLIAFPPLTLVPEGEQELQEYMQEPTQPVRCLPDWTDPEYLRLRGSCWEARHGGPGSTVAFWVMSSFITRLTLGVKCIRQQPSRRCRMHQVSSLEEKPLEVSTMVSDVMEFDAELLRPKVKRLRNDGPMPASGDPSDRLQTIRQLCATYYLEGYPDAKVVGPIKDNFLFLHHAIGKHGSTVSPAIMRDLEYARDCLAHVSLIRELFDKSSVPTDPAWLSSCGNALLQSLSGLLTHSSRLPLTK